MKRAYRVHKIIILRYFAYIKQKQKVQASWSGRRVSAIEVIVHSDGEMIQPSYNDMSV